MKKILKPIYKLLIDKINDKPTSTNVIDYYDNHKHTKHTRSGILNVKL